MRYIMIRFLILISIVASFCWGETNAQNLEPKTYCNPINIDYGYTPIPNFASQGHHRATADPVITLLY